VSERFAKMPRAERAATDRLPLTRALRARFQRIGLFHGSDAGASQPWPHRYKPSGLFWLAKSVEKGD